MSLPGSELRHRRSTIQEIVQSLDELEVDMIVATPCTNLVAQLQGSDTSEQLFLLNNQFKKDATRFEFTPKEELYWKELKRSKQSDKSNAGIIFQSLDNLQYVSGRVEEGLKAEAEVKQREEALAIEREREKTKGGRDDMNDLFGGGAEILLIQNGVNVFHIIASNSDKDEGTACRISGRVRVNKVKGDSVVITPAKGVDNLLAHFDGLFGGDFYICSCHHSGMHGKNRVDTTNLSHRIEKLNFGTSIRGLLTPLAGTEQISLEGADEYRYFLKIVPTRIFHHGVFGGSTMTYQYSVTKTVCSTN
ncbi:unnamed protein product [Anisakis simplex]|uniref:COPIIcoated_ERV domain-containing protein n=1 Tax=Anisakis simplex TaxID=6269 RepID=A0A0M3JUV0_ANISI|nr:unnamed protein product [Anisakis simplex]